MKTNLYYLFVIFLLSVSIPLTGQENYLLSTNWELAFERDSFEKINKMITSFNGYIIAVGESVSKKGKDSDGLFLVIDPKDGKRVSWKQFGGPGVDAFNAVIQNFDGTFTLAGYSHSGDDKGSSGWLVRVNQEGQLLKEATIPKRKNAEEVLIDIAINESGAVMAVGSGSHLKEPAAWVVNVNKDLYGLRKEIDISHLDRVNAVCAGNDDSFVLVGSTVDKNKDYEADAWALKIDDSGNPIWSAPIYFGDAGFQQANSICAARQHGGYLIAGCNNSATSGKKDMWVVKIEERGEVQWEQLFGGREDDIAHTIVEISEGRYVIAGQTKSHMSDPKYAALQLFMLDSDGQQIGKRIETIYTANGDNIAHSVLELFGAENIVLAASTKPEKSRDNPMPFLGAYTYRIRSSRGVSNKLDKEAVAFTKVQFVDENKDGYWAAGESGFAYLKITNQTDSHLYNVEGQLTGNGISSLLANSEPVLLGTLNAQQSRQIVFPIKMKNAIKEDFPVTIVIRSEAGEIGQIAAFLSAVKREPPRLEIGRSGFIPEVPRPGDVVKLQVELSNTGGMATPIIPVEFNLPMGVLPKSAQQQNVSPINPGETKVIEFDFSCKPDYQRDNVNVLFKTQKAPSVDAVDKTFTLSFEKATTEVQKSDKEILMVLSQPDISSQREVIDVHRNSAEIKVITVSNNKLVKSKFATRINGVRYQGQKMDKSSLTAGISDGQGKIQQSFSTTVNFKPGLNTIEIIYLDDDDQTPLGESQLIRFNYIPPENPSLWVISVGIEHEDLKYTIKDAKDFADIYEGLKSTNGHGFKKVEIRKLLSAEETQKLNLQKTFQDFREEAVKDGDLVIVFISSHGKISSAKKKFLLLPSNYDSNYEDLTAIDFEEDVLNQLRPMKGNKLVFVDACHSGAIGARYFDDKAASKVMSDLIESTKGLEIFASCSSSEQSYESENWNNGAFTKAILEAFRDKKVEVDGRMIHADIYKEHSKVPGDVELGSDGVITIRELKEFIEKRIPYLVRTNKHKPQNPKVWRDYNMDHNTGIFMVY